MAENESLDLSRVVSLIMENPKLIEEITALARSDKASAVEEATEPSAKVPESPPAEAVEAVSTYPENRPRKSRRNELLGAMKPYLSKERSKAIDSMLTIADILDMMKER